MKTGNVIGTRLWAGFVVIIAVIGVLGYQTYTNGEKQVDTNRWVTHTNEVLLSSQRLLTHIVDTETAYRGFAVTGKEEFLQPFFYTPDSIRREFIKLRQLTSDNPAQQSRIEKLDGLIRAKLAWGDSVIVERRRDRRSAGNLVTGLTGVTYMNEIRALINEFQSTEAGLLRSRTRDHQEQIDTFNTLYFTEQTVLVAIVFILFLLIYVNLKRREKAEHKLQLASEEIRDLYDNAPSGYFSIDATMHFSNVNKTMLQWLGFQEEEIVGKLRYDQILSESSRKTYLENFDKDFESYKKTRYVHDLEFDFKRKDGSLMPVMVNSMAILDEAGNFIQSRSSVTDYTAQKTAIDRIKSLNGELEAFTYSVSHDLRSPLRSITGYAQILMEDYKDRMDDEGRRITSVIISSGARMGRLIDDLLEFSRVGRKELVMANVDTMDLVRSLLEEFEAQRIESRVKIECQSLPPCKGDISMIRQVWINLISNAIKYSSKKESPAVKISSFRENGSVCFCVADNGVGFDMKYINKLFGVFQRLHKMTDFEGTGVGLALVKRIIDKHNGSVWAESTLNEGARFYFSLPNTNQLA